MRKKGFGDEEVTVLKPITGGKVLEATKRHARVQVPINVVLPVGSAVMKVSEPYLESKIHREKPTGTELAMTVRPFIPIDTLGGGVVIDFETIHRFEDSPLTVTLVLSPLAFAMATNFYECPNYEAGLSEAEGKWAAKYNGEADFPARIGVIFFPGREFANFDIYGCVFEFKERKGKIVRAFKIQMTISNDALGEFNLQPGTLMFPGKMYSLYSNYDRETDDQDIYLVSNSSQGSATITNFDPLNKTIEGSFNVESIPFVRTESEDKPINVETSFSLNW